MRRWVTCLVLVAASAFVAAPAWACGGLVAPNGSVNLLRTTTLAGYHDGVEHYVTSFEFAGGGGRFGSIIPLPGIPTDVVRGGDWTLQRLVQEVTPVRDAFRLAEGQALASAPAEVVLETRIDALDITILKGGGDAVGTWALDNGFALPPDAPEVLDFYASRSPIFMAASFDAAEAERLDQQVGDGTPIHLSIPTEDPWVPLRILSLGRKASETVEADVFLLTDEKPNLLPQAGDTMSLEVSSRASDQLLADLRSDKGMGWIPESGMWLSYLKIETAAGALDHDLAIDPTGTTMPSRTAAGLVLPDEVEEIAEAAGRAPLWAWALAAAFVAGVIALANRFVTEG